MADEIGEQGMHETSTNRVPMNRSLTRARTLWAVAVVLFSLKCIWQVLSLKTFRRGICNSWWQLVRPQALRCGIIDSRRQLCIGGRNPDETCHD